MLLTTAAVLLASVCVLDLATWAGFAAQAPPGKSLRVARLDLLSPDGKVAGGLAIDGGDAALSLASPGRARVRLAASEAGASSVRCASKNSRCELAIGADHPALHIDANAERGRVALATGDDSTPASLLLRGTGRRATVALSTSPTRPAGIFVGGREGSAAASLATYEYGGRDCILGTGRESFLALAVGPSQLNGVVLHPKGGSPRHDPTLSVQGFRILNDSSQPTAEFGPRGFMLRTDKYLGGAGGSFHLLTGARGRSDIVAKFGLEGAPSDAALALELGDHHEFVVGTEQNKPHATFGASQRAGPHVFLYDSGKQNITLRGSESRITITDGSKATVFLSERGASTSTKRR
jgi:hypothetical protein